MHLRRLCAFKGGCVHLREAVCIFGHLLQAVIFFVQILFI